MNEHEKTTKLLEELAQRKKQHEEERKQERLRWQLRAEPVFRKIKFGGKVVKEFGTAVKPYAKAAYEELEPDVKTAAREVWKGATSYIKHIATAPPQTKFILTPKGRSALKSYLQGDYSILPLDSIRAHLLDIAKSQGFFSIGGAVSMYGDIGIAATQILVEQELIERST